MRPALTADDAGVTVRNPFSTKRVGYGEIMRCITGYYGITIRTRSGAVVAWAVQKSNLTTWLHRRTRADEVARVIEQRATET